MSEPDQHIPAWPTDAADTRVGPGRELQCGVSPCGRSASADDEHTWVEGTPLTRGRMMWFIRLRWLFLAGAVAALLVEQVLRPVARPPELLIVLAALALVNLFWAALARHALESGKADSGAAASAADAASAASDGRALALANAQVAVDLLLLTAILRYTGGVESPLAIFYLFHMPIASLLLRGWQALLQGAWAALLFAGLAVGELSGALSPHYPFLPSAAISDAPERFADPALVLAAVVTLACGVFGTLYFTLNIATRLQERERQLRRANRALRESEQAIRDLERRRSRFMQTAAHQLKSPLAVIQTLAGLVRDGIVPADQTVDICATIARRCREGIDQVGELLTLARVHEADPRRHVHAAADVALIASDLCSRFAPLAEQKRIRLCCRVDGAPIPPASVDPTDLADCLSNLIDNAIKYTPAGGHVQVSVSTVELEADPHNGGGPFVRVSVRDTGMGIEPDALKAVDGEPGHEAIFDAFRRGSNALAAGVPGTGLGLSIVREVVEQSRGRIRVRSRPGEGSEFSVYFPTRGMPASDEPRVRSTRASQVVIEAATAEPGRGPGEVQSAGFRAQNGESPFSFGPHCPEPGTPDPRRAGCHSLLLAFHSLLPASIPRRLGRAPRRPPEPVFRMEAARHAG